MSSRSKELRIHQIVQNRVAAKMVRHAPDAVHQRQTLRVAIVQIQM